MKTKGKRNVDNIHKGVFPLPINSNVSQKTDTPQYKELKSIVGMGV